jgi:hypothetical protein
MKLPQKIQIGLKAVSDVARVIPPNAHSIDVARIGDYEAARSVIALPHGGTEEYWLGNCGRAFTKTGSQSSTEDEVAR